MRQVRIYTDGACRGNPGPGGWGAVLESGGRTREMQGAQADTTNNRMELLAAIEALGSLPERCEVEVVTDSEYLMKGVRFWMGDWKRKGWKTTRGKPVKNQDLWQRLDDLLPAHQVRWRWVRGHTGVSGNERADALANAAIDRMLAP